MYICVCVYIYIYIHTYIIEITHTRTRAHAHTQIHMHTQTHARTRTHARTHTHTHIHTYIIWRQLPSLLVEIAFGGIHICIFASVMAQYSRHSHVYIRMMHTRTAYLDTMYICVYKMHALAAISAGKVNEACSGVNGSDAKRGIRNATSTMQTISRRKRKCVSVCPCMSTQSKDCVRHPRVLLMFNPCVLLMCTAFLCVVNV
jgi:hypothetical protein